MKSLHDLCTQQSGKTARPTLTLRLRLWPGPQPQEEQEPATSKQQPQQQQQEACAFAAVQGVWFEIVQLLSEMVFDNKAFPCRRRCFAECVVSVAAMFLECV